MQRYIEYLNSLEFHVYEIIIMHSLCVLQECPQWSDWSPCSVSCGEGISDRSRDCPGSMEYQSESCEEHPIRKHII